MAALSSVFLLVSHPPLLDVLSHSHTLCAAAVGVAGGGGAKSGPRRPTEGHLNYKQKYFGFGEKEKVLPTRTVTWALNRACGTRERTRERERESVCVCVCVSE